MIPPRFTLPLLWQPIPVLQMWQEFNHHSKKFKTAMKSAETDFIDGACSSWYIESHLMIPVKLPALPRGHLWENQAELRRSQPGFALRAAPRSPAAIPPVLSAQGILTKAS
jgi:hypothetical protein